MLLHNYENLFEDEDFQRRNAELQRDPDFQAHRYDAYEERTGFKTPMHNPAVLEHRRENNQEKYHRDGVPFSDDRYIPPVTDPTKLAEYLAFKKDPAAYLLSNYDEKPSVYELCRDLGVTDTTIYDELIEANCRHLVSRSRSIMEIQISEYISSICSDIIVEQNIKYVIDPLELDIYLPEKKFAIECNPTFTHNSSFPAFGSDPPKHRMYHKYKSTKASEAGVFLFHVFGYEWKHKQEIIKSMISNVLGKTPNVYGARETYVCEISYSDCKEFLDANHRQGNTQSKIRLGLKLKSTNELVSVMTFGRPRHTIGRTSNDKNVWELSRFCSKLFTHINGGLMYLKCASSV